MPPFFVEDMTEEQKAEYFAFLESTKGGNVMDCKHEQIMCRNCVKICLKCGKELPADFQTGKPSPAEGTPGMAQETPKKTTRKKVK